MTGSSLLVVGDDEEALGALVECLLGLGHDVEVARSVDDARRRLVDRPAELVLLAATVGGGSTLPFCSWLRATLDVPLVVTGPPGTGTEVVEALEAGADGFLVRPFRPHEVGARIRALLRRSTRGADPVPGPDQRAVLERGDVRIDAGTRLVTVGGRSHHLPRKELELLWLLVASAGQVVRRERLVRLVWGTDLHRSAKTLDVHVGRLREKIEPDPSRPTRIVTIRSVGFRYEPVEEGSARTGEP